MPNRETLPAFKTDANTKERPNTWKTKYDARTIPAGLNIHASLGWKCTMAIKECITPHPGQGIPRSFRARQKCGRRMRTGEIVRANRLDSKTPR